MPALPLAGWADRELAALAAMADTPALHALRGRDVMGERAALNGLCLPGRVSAGGGCRLYAARGDHVALNLARSDDRDLLPALFEAECDGSDAAIVAAMARADASALVARGRTMGLAIAALSEEPPAPALTVTPGPAAPPPTRAPLVIDLSALWAGPLAGHLLHLAGAEVGKVESLARPDAMRTGDPALFDRLNGGKASVAIDMRGPALPALLARADIVIEAARPRALLQLGIDADALIRARPGLVWISITGHGGTGAAAGWVGFGDDCAVAGGLSRALRAASGAVGFVGDAPADPLTGIHAARLGWAHWRRGTGARLTLAMSGVVAAAIAAEGAALAPALRQHAQAAGRPFPAVAPRTAVPARPLGADTARWLAPC